MPDERHAIPARLEAVAVPPSKVRNVLPTLRPHVVLRWKEMGGVKVSERTPFPSLKDMTAELEARQNELYLAMGVVEEMPASDVTFSPEEAWILREHIRALALLADPEENAKIKNSSNGRRPCLTSARESR